jgi:hypothetical protein
LQGLAGNLPSTRLRLKNINVPLGVVTDRQAAFIQLHSLIACGLIPF